MLSIAKHCEIAIALTNVNIIDTPLVEFKSLLKNEKAPANDSWRTGLLNVFIHARDHSDYRTEMNLSQQYVSTMLILNLYYN